MTILILAATIAAIISPTQGYVGDKVTVDAPAKVVEFSGPNKTFISAAVVGSTTYVPTGAITGPVKIGKVQAQFTVLTSPVVVEPETATVQTRTLGPGTYSFGSNQNGQASGAPLKKTYEDYMDLPVEKPEPLPPKTQKPTPPSPPNPPQPPPHEVPPSIYGKDIHSSSGTIYYVLDISGSMGWDMGQYTAPDGSTATGVRIDRAKSELTKSITSLPKSFKFNVMAYDCSYYQWKTSMQPVDDVNKASAIKWVGSLQPQGATGTGPAMTIALQDKENKLVVLLTDGAPNCGSRDEDGSWDCMMGHLSQIDCANTQKARIDVFGIGATGTFKQWCIMVASQNGGSYTDVR
jgi:hypothetical protein